MGKLIVAVDEAEEASLHKLLARGKANGVQGLRLLNAEQIKEVEPHCRGVAAIHCPTTAIVDWGAVARSFAADFQAAGGAVYLDHEVIDFKPIHGSQQQEKDFSRGICVVVRVVCETLGVPAPAPRLLHRRCLSC